MSDRAFAKKSPAVSLGFVARDIRDSDNHAIDCAPDCPPGL